jgi:hypothetical protein
VFNPSDCCFDIERVSSSGSRDIDSQAGIMAEEVARGFVLGEVEVGLTELRVCNADMVILIF